MSLFKWFFLYSFFLLTISCLPGLDSNANPEQELEYFVINSGHAAIDFKEKFILYPLSSEYFKQKDFLAKIVYPAYNYELYLEDSLIENNSDYLFKQISINDTFKLSFVSPKSKYDYKLIFNTLPVVHIFSSSPLNEVKLPASITITSSNPDENLSSKYIGIELRGQYALKKK